MRTAKNAARHADELVEDARQLQDNLVGALRADAGVQDAVADPTQVDAVVGPEQVLQVPNIIM